jgi:hypothetical protein
MDDTLNAIKCVIQDGGNTITVDGTVAVTNAGLTALNGAITGTEVQVDVLTMPTVTVNSHAVTNAGTFAVQATLAAETTKVIGTVNVAASQTIGVTQATAGNLNMTEASASAIKTAVEALDNAVDGNYLNTNMNVAGTDVAAGTGTQNAQTLRVVLATDQAQLTNKLLVTEDSASAIKTAVEIMDDWDDSNYCNVNNNIAGTDIVGGAGAVAAGVQRVTLASDDPAVTSLAILDDWDSGDTCKVTIQNTSIIGTGSPVIDTFSHVAINLTTGADQVLVASSASHQIWVYGYGFTCGDADGQTVSLQDEDNAALTGIMEFMRYGGISVPPNGNFSMPLFKLGTDKDLEIDITGGDVDGWLVYAIVNA